MAQYGKLDEQLADLNHIQVLALTDEPGTNGNDDNNLLTTDDSNSDQLISSMQQIENNIRSTKKNYAYICCGCIAVILIGMFCGYQFQQRIENDTTPQTEHDDNSMDDSYFIKSPSDTDRQFSFITLPNDLQILLISDNTTEKAAVAIDVAVGSSQDPEDFLGLAHFHGLYISKYNNTIFTYCHIQSICCFWAAKSIPQKMHSVLL